MNASLSGRQTRSDRATPGGGARSPRRSKDASQRAGSVAVFGPSTTWLVRKLVAGLEASPAGFDLDLEETAHCLGLGHKGGRHSPFVRALTRCVQFDVAQPQGEGVLAVRRKLAPLNRRQIVRLTPALQAKHEEWQQGQLKIPKVEQLRRRSRQLALSLLELGEDVEATERQLQRWQFHPALAYESSRWAWARHKDALAAAEAPEQLRLPAPSIAPAVVAAAAALSRIEGAA